MKTLRHICHYLLSTAFFMLLGLSAAPVYAADTITFSEYLDQNTNGQIDAIRWTMDENVTACNYEAGDWTVDTPGDFNLNITGLSCTGVDNFLVIQVSADPNETGSSVDPEISYADNGVAGSVTLTSGNMGAHATWPVTDQAPPVYVASATLDNDNDGTVDLVRIDYSEPIDDSSVSAADYELGIAGTGAGNLSEFFTSGIPASGNEIDTPNDSVIYVAFVSSGESIVDGKTDYALKVEQVVGGGGVDDNSVGSNTLDSFGPADSVDGASPIIYDVQIEDTGTGDGLIDKLVFTWTENIDTDDGSAPVSGDLPTTTLPDGSSADFSAAFISDPAGASNVVTVTGITGQVAPFTSQGVTAISGDISASWAAAAGPDPIAAATASASITDAAPPFPYAAQTLDTDGNGKVDHIEISFSEAIADATMDSFQAGTNYTPNSLAIANVNNEAVDASEGVCPNDVNSSDAYLCLVFDEDAGSCDASSQAGCDTGDVDQDITWTGASILLEDQLGVQVNDLASGTLIEADGADPVVVGRLTRDTDQVDGSAGTADGQMDGVLVIFSENMDASSAVVGDFTMTTGADVALTEAYNDTTDDDTLFFGVTDSAADDTSDLIKSQITGVILDLVGHAVATDGATVAATDGAGPFITSGIYSDSNSDGKIDEVVLGYTENTTFTADAADWNFSVAGDINLTGDFDAAECVGSGTTVITCTDADTGTFDADANETGVGAAGTNPDWTYTSSANVTDGAANQAPTQTVTLADQADPLVIDADLDYNDNVSTLTINFTEEVSAASADETLFHINDVTGVDDITLTQPTASADGTSLIFDLTEAERVQALLISGVAGGDAGAVVLDMDTAAITDTSPAANSNLADDDNNTVNETADTNAPTLTQWDIDFNTDQFTLTFSETVDVSTVDWTTVTIQDAASAVNSYVLTGGSTASGNGTVVVLDLVPADINAIKGNSNIATSSANAWMVLTAAMIDDLGQNDITAIADGSALQANSFAGSGSIGDLTNAHFLLANSYVNQSGRAGVRFKTEGAIPADGKIEIVIPAEFGLTGLSAVENINNMDGTVTFAVNSQTVTITRQNDGTPVGASVDVAFDLSDVTNPGTEGATSTFTFRTLTDADAIVDENTAVAGPTIVVPPYTPATQPVATGGGGGGGGGSNPPIKVAGLVKEEEAKAAAKAAEEAAEAAAAEEEEEQGHFAAGPAPEFMDTFGHWAEGYIRRIAQMGIVEGKGENRFAPNDNITRAELLKIALGSFEYDVPEDVTQNPLPDVMIGDWYAPYVKAAFENDIIYGFNNGFGPNSPASRGMAATVLVKAAGYDDVDEHFAENYVTHSDWNFAGFPDVPMDAYFAPYVSYLADMQIVSGYEDGTFGPGNPITRAEIAKVVTNILGLDPLEAEESEAEDMTSEESATEDEEMMEGQGLTNEAENKEVWEMTGTYYRLSSRGSALYFRKDSEPDKEIHIQNAEFLMNDKQLYEDFGLKEIYEVSDPGCSSFWGEATIQVTEAQFPSEDDSDVGFVKIIEKEEPICGPSEFQIKNHPALEHCGSFPEHEVIYNPDDTEHVVCYDEAYKVYTDDGCYLIQLGPIEDPNYSFAYSTYDLLGDQIGGEGKSTGNITVDYEKCLPTTKAFFDSIVE